MSITIDKWEVCINCGHIMSFHSGLHGECEACDDPTIPIEKKCPYFKAKEKEVIKLGY